MTLKETRIINKLICKCVSVEDVIETFKLESNPKTSNVTIQELEDHAKEYFKKQTISLPLTCKELEVLETVLIRFSTSLSGYGTSNIPYDKFVSISNKVNTLLENKKNRK